MVDSCCRNLATKLRATCPALKPRQAAEPPLSPCSLLYALNCFNMSDYMSDEHVLGTPGAPPCCAKPLNLHSSRVPCYMCYMCYILHAKPPTSTLPGFLAICAICAISYTPSRRTSTLPQTLAICAICAISYTPSRESGCSVACLVRYSTYSTYSKDPGEWMFSCLPCESHIAHKAHIARARGTVRVRLGACRA